MRTKAEEYQMIVDLYDKSTNDDEFINRVVSLIGLNNLDKDNLPLATMLDFAIEYTDDPTTEGRRRVLQRAILAIVGAIGKIG